MGKYQKNIEAARSVTIMQYLATCHPGELVRKADDEYCTKTHSSLVITPSKDLFHWFSQNIGGRSALDYMTNVERVDFVSAVRFLNELTPVPVSSQMAKMPTPAKQQDSREFELPKADKNCEAVAAYLMHRGISPKVLRYCLNEGILYQTTRGNYRNCVFVGKDEGGVPRSAFQRGCQGTYRGDVTGSQKKYGFLMQAENLDCDTVELYEAPIDAMSGATLRQYKLNDQSRKDDVVTFEQLGVDSLMVDEAHAFKNLAVLSKMRNVAGISQTESQRASDLYMKCRYLDEITGSRGVVFATGTPISNSMAELFTMQRYLQRETLEQHGLSSFDAWASTFGETVTAVELAPEGTGYRTKTRFSKFYNLPELMSMFKQVADVQTADMLNLPVPKLVGGKPINVALPPSPQQRQMVADLADRAEEIRAGNVDPTEDNMLKVTNDGRKLALDQRLIDPNLPENPNDKVHACAENVYRIWSETKDKKLTQLVFCDLSTPKPDGFNVYDDLRNLLISMGIPENEVQFIHSANTEVKKAELFAKVRSGDVRILMGSTGKMGAGTNVQRLLVATHHLDCGWKPSDIEQRNGRMIRQGNTNAEVYEYRYVTESSFDSYMWQLLETKQKFIGQVMTSKSPARSADDLDDAALSYAEVKALAAGNPMIKEKMDLDIQVARLKTLKTAYNNEHYRLEDAITQGFPAEMRKTAQQLENAKADTALLQQNTKRDADGKDIFTITLMDTFYTKREDAGKALLGLLGMAMNRTEPVSIGRYKGFDLQIAYFAMDKMYLAYLVGNGINPVQLGADAVGNTVRLDNCLHNLPQSVTDLESKLVQLQKQLENAKEQLAQPFAQADELAEKSKRLAELEALLNLNEKDIVLDTVPDEEQQCRSDNRQRGQER